MEFKIILTIICIAATGSASIGAGVGVDITAVYGDKKSPYQSGYSHAENDCELAQKDRASQMYILEPDKGPAYHTQQFMDGYYDGWYNNGNGCPVQDLNHMLYLDVPNDNISVEETNTAVDDSFNNRDSVIQPQSQSANTVQSAGCPSQIINGDCIIGQDQNTSNDFAQANRAEN